MKEKNLRKDLENDRGFLTKAHVYFLYKAIYSQSNVQHTSIYQLFLE